MNHIERLIEEMCPDGVPFKPLGQVALVKRGTSITKKDIRPGEVPVIAGGRTPAYFHAEANRVGPLITVAGSGAYAGFVSFWEQPIFVSDASSIETDPLSLLPRFAFHLLKWKQDLLHSLKAGGGVPHVYAKDIAKIVVPTPPLAVQREIVEILDKFSKLEAELEAELEARNTQLNAVRESLFTNLEDYTAAPLSTITVESYSGMTPRATEKRYYDGGTIPWLRSQDINFNIIQNATSFITEKALRETSLQMIPSNCLIVAISGASAGRSATNAFPTTTNQHCCCLKIDASKADLRYVYHWLASNYLVLKNMGRGARGDLNHSIIKSLPIKLPPIEVQQSCARMLDNLSNLVSSHVDGLPAEITARRQQYEYYRDRLLTFKELQ
ncbi:restriction endonuclease subunit S [Buchananella felis]|uniref:restriction endonuclease subunit S n=1 Tax=Buchananella felis TaxID=3231492 RepID=UPI003529CC7C